MDDQSFKVALRVFAISLLILPLFLAAARYFLEELETEELDQFDQLMLHLLFFLAYLSLVGASFNSGGYLVNNIYTDPGTAVIYLYIFHLIVGIAVVDLIRREYSISISFSKTEFESSDTIRGQVRERVESIDKISMGAVIESILFIFLLVYIVVLLYRLSWKI